jgi:hypothetical protein
MANDDACERLRSGITSLCFGGDSTDGSVVIAKLDVSDDSAQDGSTLNPDFEENMKNVVADAVAEASPTTTPINFGDAATVQPFPVPVGRKFNSAVLLLIYDTNLIAKVEEIREMVELRTDRVVRVDVVPV